MDEEDTPLEPEIIDLISRWGVIGPLRVIERLHPDQMALYVNRYYEGGST